MLSAGNYLKQRKKNQRLAKKIAEQVKNFSDNEAGDFSDEEDCIFFQNICCKIFAGTVACQNNMIWIKA